MRLGEKWLRMRVLDGFFAIISENREILNDAKSERNMLVIR